MLQRVYYLVVEGLLKDPNSIPSTTEQGRGYKISGEICCSFGCVLSRDINSLKSFLKCVYVHICGGGEDKNCII